MNAKILKTLLAACALSATIGCSGSRVSIRAPTANYPISLSDGVRDADGSLLATERKMPVGEFKHEFRTWSWVLSRIPLTGGKGDISSVVNEQVAAVGGEAIIDFKAQAEPCWWSVFTLVGLLWPDCTNYWLSGRIIKAVAVASAATPASAPPAPASAPPAPPQAGTPK